MANPGQQPLTVEQRLTQNGENFQEHQTVEEVLSDSQKDLDLLTVEQKMRSESEALESSIINGSESLSEQESLGRKVASLLNEYKALRDGISSREGSRRTRNQLRHRLKDNINSLEAIQKDLGKYKYHNLATYKARVLELDYYFEHYEQVRQLIVLGGRTGDIHAIIDSKQDARRARRQEKQNARYQSSMNDILHEAALTSLWDRDMERYEEYLEAVLNGQVEPSTHPFFTAHRQSFALIQQTSPELYGTLVPRGGGRIAYNTYCQREPQLYQQCCRRYNEGFNTKFGKGMTDILAKVFPGIDSDPRKRQAREKAGSVIALGGAVVMGFQFFKNLFSKKADNPSKWGKAAGWGAGLLALFYGDRVIDWAKDAFGIHPAEKSRMLMEISSTYGFSDTEAMKIADKYISAPIATMSALHFIPIYDLTEQHIIENKNGEFSFNYKNYKKFVDQYSWDKNQKEQVLKAGEKLRDDNSIGAGLKAFGIATRSKLTGLFNGDKNKTLADTDEAKTGWGKMVERVSHGVNKALYNHGLKAKDADTMDKIMAEYGEGEKSQKETSRLILTRMTRGRLELASDDNFYTVHEMLHDPALSSQINFERMTMKGFTNSGGDEIEFESYGDLFYAVRLTNWIKKNFNRPAVSENPFHITAGRIEFDNTLRYEARKNDTKIVKRRTLKEKSSLLYKNKEFYIDYLNRRRREQNMIKIDTSKYPFVSQLNIDFYNDENEVKNIDNWLKKIKIDSDNNKYVPHATDNEPFKINRVSGNLEFKGVGGTIVIEKNLSQFPTLKKNKEKLLAFLNNKNNGMCKRYGAQTK